MANGDKASSPIPWPPILFGGSLIVGALVSQVWPWHILPLAARDPLRMLGLVAIAAGLVVIRQAGSQFLRAGTPVIPTAPTKAIVVDGLYRYSRNPMYCAMAVALFGAGLALDSGWLLLLVPLGVFAVTKLAIEREEVYLAQRFGAEYLDYKAKVRRWL